MLKLKVFQCFISIVDDVFNLCNDVVGEGRKTQEEQRMLDVQPLNISRDTDGEFTAFVQEMQATVKEKHHQYFRMSALKFNKLLK